MGKHKSVTKARANKLLKNIPPSIIKQALQNMTKPRVTKITWSTYHKRYFCKCGNSYNVEPNKRCRRCGSVGEI